MKIGTLLTTTLLTFAGVANAEDIRTAPVKTHPSQGDVVVMENATARLSTHKDGLFVNFDTEGLTPGNVHTLWLVVINDPKSCFDISAVKLGHKTNPADCTSRDVLLRSDEVQSDVGWAGGLIVGDDGTASFAFHQTEGALTNAWFGNELQVSDQAEIHLVINDHGPVLPGEEADMLGSYRGGCADASIPKPMPATARADGKPGPNTCRLVQAAIFKLPGASS